MGFLGDTSDGVLESHSTVMGMPAFYLGVRFSLSTRNASRRRQQRCAGGSSNRLSRFRPASASDHTAGSDAHLRCQWEWFDQRLMLTPCRLSNTHGRIVPCRFPRQTNPSMTKAAVTLQFGQLV